ncbi:MinD/ParA family protein [Niameybacter massiliensis]|uniref:MinD/ParA family protein n=1 Tax=Holtiella tumoricola TaxID=3018743 RepID=A0AA42DNK1_9FIRM|nr:MinD/ParA family protein [Holtiella tumoricola]MDA3732607.1 MinD/ParA family protein [Holtiella tumoricola]
MNDQAQALRDLVSKKNQPMQKMKIITVTSGKGGVGKSNFTTNLALSLKEYGKTPVILDADFGLANVEIILGQRPKYNLSHLIHKKCTFSELVCESQYGIPFISGGSGVKDMLFLSQDEMDTIANQLTELEQRTDLLLIDTGAGINEIVLKFCQLADEVYVIVTPEPASMTDAYALIKTLVKDFSLTPQFNIVINKAMNREEAHDVYRKMAYVVKEFLQASIRYAGYIPYDPKLFEAVKNQRPVIHYAPKCSASEAYKAIGRSILNMPEPERSLKTSWLDKFKKVFSS